MSLDASGQKREEGKNYSYYQDKSGKIQRQEIVAGKSPPTTSNTSSTSSGKGTTKYVTYTDADGKQRTLTEGSYQRFVQDGKITPEQHLSAKGATSSSTQFFNAEQQKYIKSGGDQSSIGAETVEKLIDAQVERGEITPQEAQRRKSEAYTSESALLTSVGAGQERVQGFINTGKTTPDKVYKEIEKPYVQQSAISYLYGGSWVTGQPSYRQTITQTLHPSAIFGLDDYSTQQLSAIEKAQNEYSGISSINTGILFKVESDGSVILNPNLSPNQIKEAERLASKYNIRIGDKLNISNQRPASQETTSKFQFTPTPLDDPNSTLYRRIGDDYFLVGEEQLTPAFKQINGMFHEYTKVDTLSGEAGFVVIPEDYKWEKNLGFAIPKDMEYKGGIIWSGDVAFKQSDGKLIPNFMLVTNPDTSKLTKQYFKLGADGQYYIETTSTSTTTIIPEGFTKINNKLEIPEVVKEKMGVKESLLKDLPIPDIYESEGVFYQRKGDTLKPYYTYMNGEKVYATNIKDLDFNKYSLADTVKLVNHASVSDTIFLSQREQKQDTRHPNIIRMEENLERMSEFDEMDMKRYGLEQGIGKDISNLLISGRNLAYKKVVETQTGWEGFYDDTLAPAIRSISIAVPATQLMTVAGQATKMVTGVDYFELPREALTEMGVSFVEVLFKTPSKILGGYGRGGYEYQLYEKQKLYGLKDSDMQEYFGISLPRSAVDSTVLFAEGALYTAPVITGVAGGIQGVIAKTSLTPLKSVTTPISSNILSNPYVRAGVMGATFGAGSEIYKVALDGKEFSVRDLVLSTAKGSGAGAGFVATSALFKAGTIYTIEGSGKLATASKNLIFEDVTISPRDKGLLRLQESYKGSDGAYEWTAQFQRTQYKPFIRDLFVSEKDVFINLPFEKVKYTGTTMTYTPTGQSPTSIFTGGGVSGSGLYGQTTIMNSFLYQPNQVVTVSKHFYFGEEVGRSLSFSKIQNIGETNLISTGKDFNLGSKNVLDIPHKATFQVDAILSKNYYAPKVKGDITLNINGKPTPATYEYFDFKNIKPTLTKGYSPTLSKLEALNIETPFKQAPTQTGGYSPAYITFDDSISFYDPDAFVKEIKIEKPLTKDTSIQRIKIDKSISTDQETGLGKSSMQIQLTKTETVLSQKPIASISLQDTQYLYSFEQNIAKVNQAVSSVGVLSRGLEKTKTSELSLTGQKELTIVQTGLVPKTLELQRTFTRDLTKRETGLIITERTDIVPIQRTNIIPIETQKVDIITITNTRTIIEIPVDVIPGPPIPPIPIPPIPPILRGGGDPAQWVPRKFGQSKILGERRVMVASLSARFVGGGVTRLRGTSLDPRKEALPSREYNSFRTPDVSKMFARTPQLPAQKKTTVAKTLQTSKPKTKRLVTQNRIRIPKIKL